MASSNPLNQLIGGWRGALESILPPAVFVITYVSTGSVTWASWISIGLAIAFAIWRIAQGKRPTRALTALLVVIVSAYIAVRFDSATAFFWPRVLVNVISALAFVVSIMVKWPLIGVIMGPLVGTKMRWRQDPLLVKAYSRATWLWAALSLIRAAILVPLIQYDILWGLAASGAFFYLLVIITVVLSWVVIRRTLADGHPGIRSPQVPHEA